MRIIDDNMTLSNFEAWAGGVYTQEEIINAGKEREFEDLIDELYPDGLTETELNDLLWFDSDWIYETLDIEVEE